MFHILAGLIGAIGLTLSLSSFSILSAYAVLTGFREGPWLAAGAAVCIALSCFLLHWSLRL